MGLQRDVHQQVLEIEITGVAGAYGIVIEGKTVPVLCMEAKQLGGEFQLSEEHDDFVWAPMAELGKWELTEGFREFVIRYIEDLTG